MSETYTFRSIFSKPISYAKDEDPIVISKVIIPRIQRPYAQGRLGEAETKIRNSFLKDIFKYLTSENDAIMDFHFIYGSIKNIEDITNQIAGNRLMLLGLGLKGSVDSLTPSYLAAILEQNWILIRQNEQIIELLKDKH